MVNYRRIQLIRVWTTLRALLFIPFIGALTLVLGAPTILLGLCGYADPALHIVRLWNRTLLWFNNVKVKVLGKEFCPLPGQPGVLFVFNHQSHFDIPIIFEATRCLIRFGAKVELFSIPIFGHALRATKMLPIARDNREEVFRVYQAAQREFAQGTNYVLAPEGTRQKTPELGRFKRGPFVFAINSQVPIVPIVISGAFAILPKNRWLPAIEKWSYRVSAEFLPPIQTLGKNQNDVEAVTELVRSQMHAALARSGPGLG